MQAESTSYCIQQPPIYQSTYEPLWDRYSSGANFSYMEESLLNDFSTSSNEYPNDLMSSDMPITSYVTDNLVSRDFNFSQIQKFDEVSPQGAQPLTSRDYIYPIPHQQQHYFNQAVAFSRNSEFQSFSDSDSGVNSPESLSPSFNDVTSWDSRMPRGNMQNFLSIDYSYAREPTMPLADQFLSKNYESPLLNMDEYANYPADPIPPPPLFHNAPIEPHNYISDRGMVKMEYRVNKTDSWPASVLRTSDQYHPTNTTTLSSAFLKQTQQKFQKKRQRTKRRRGANKEKNVHLWEFIRDILLEPKYCPTLMKWEDKEEGVFRFVKSDAVAHMWGRKKQNPKMTYEKLSRAMRYYYSRGILERVDGRRLVYKFGPNSHGWRNTNKDKSFEDGAHPASPVNEKASKHTPTGHDVTMYPVCKVENPSSRDGLGDNPSLLPSADVLLSGSSAF